MGELRVSRLAGKGIELRRARVDDIPVIRSLAREIWLEVYPAILSIDQIHYMLERMYAPEKISGEIESGTVYLVASRAGADMGYMAHGKDVDSGDRWLHKLYLLPAHHGGGVGQQLLQHVVLEAAISGQPGVRLRVNRRNERAIRAYRRAGFETIREVMTDFGSGYFMDDFEMRRPSW